MIEIHWTCGSLDEARGIARHLVQAHLVASAQIIPWIESMYLWNGGLHSTQETKVIFKTKKELFQDVKEVIVKNSKYHIPEVTSFKMEDVNPAYQEWLKTAINAHTH